MNRWAWAIGVAAAISSQPVVAEDHAKVSLVSEVSHYESGEAFKIGIRMDHQAHWHSYWLNPGEGGFTTKWTWKLPAGWKVVDLAWPVPQHMSTGELKSYGYLDQLVFLANVQPPAGAKGPVQISADVSWLTCNEDQCVPGKGTATMTLTSEEVSPVPAEVALISAAMKKVPQPTEAVHLSVTEQNGKLLLKFSAPSEMDLTGAEVFPVTKQALSPAEKILIQGKTGDFQVSVPKSEYAEGEIRALELVVAGGKLAAPFRIEWKKS